MTPYDGLAMCKNFLNKPHFELSTSPVYFSRTSFLSPHCLFSFLKYVAQLKDSNFIPATNNTLFEHIKSDLKK